MNAPDQLPNESDQPGPDDLPVTDTDLETANQAGQQTQQASQEAAEKWEDFKESHQQSDADAWQEVQRKVEKATQS